MNLRMKFGRNWGRLGMKSKLSDICFYRKEKIAVAELDRENYISTENMLPDKNGVTIATSLPTTIQTQKYAKGDILVSNIRPYFKKIWFADKNGGCSNDVLVFKTKNRIDPRYLYYILADDSFFDYSMATAKGTKMPRGDKKALMEYEVPDYDLNEQNKIAGVLSPIDDKIQLNNKINKNLQSQALAIYIHMIVKKADESWHTGLLSDIASITMGQSPKGDSYNENGIGTVFFQGRAEFSFRFPSRKLYTTEPKRIAKTNDILMSVRAPVGDLNVAYEDCCIGRGLSAIHSKDNHQSFVLYTMFVLRRQLDVFNGEGTVFGSINRDALNSIPISIPPRKVMDKFESIVAPMDAIIRFKYEENCRLQAMRDSLLPRLMSGELDISALNI